MYHAGYEASSELVVPFRRAHRARCVEAHHIMAATARLVAQRPHDHTLALLIRVHTNWYTTCLRRTVQAPVTGPPVLYMPPDRLEVNPDLDAILLSMYYAQTKAS